jgi:hypothetical protein
MFLKFLFLSFAGFWGGKRNFTLFSVNLMVAIFMTGGRKPPGVKIDVVEPVVLQEFKSSFYWCS